MLVFNVLLSASYSVESLDIAPFVGFRLLFSCSGCVANPRVSVGVDFGQFQLGPVFAYVSENDEGPYAADFECGLPAGGDAV